ncbi:MAG: aldo/keto reductase [Phycisphaeraceae bacterium]|nr:aldo/keto reductase [Phycisphaeraceae bacterium]
MDSSSQFSRRTLLTAGAGAGAALAVPGLAQSAARAAMRPQEKQDMKIEHRTFGKTGLSVAVLGFGGSEIGYERTDDATVAKLLNAALDAGLNVVDTAECYIASEEQIARAIGHRRKDFHIFTKVGHWIPEGKTEAWGWTKEGVLASIDRSLQRLKTDHVELVQIHSCGIEELKQGGCVEGLQEAQKQGKTRFIGYSGDREAALHAINMDVFGALQTSVNIADQQCIELFLPQAKAKNMGVIAKRPIANAAWRHDADPNNYGSVYWQRFQKLQYPFATGDARKMTGPDGPVGIALRFTLQQPGVHVAIVGTSKPERWSENAALTQAGPLKPEQLKAIRDRWKAIAPADWGGMT